MASGLFANIRPACQFSAFGPWCRRCHSIKLESRQPRLRQAGARILVEKEDHLLLEIRLRETTGIAVFGNVQVTTQALSELLDHRIPLALYTRHGRLKGRLVPDLSGNVLLRVAQYRTSLDDSASLAFAQAVVRAKLRNAGKLLADYRTHYPSDSLAAACQSLDAAAAGVPAVAGHPELLK